MKSFRNAVINFGMVTIPVGLGSVTKPEQGFRTLHNCGTPVKEQKWCPNEEKLVEPEELVKGFEYAKGQFVTFTEDELAELMPPRDPTVKIKKFVRITDIKPTMIADKYWLIPNDLPRLAEAYGTLYQALAETKRAGLGSHSLWGKEHPCAIVPIQDYISGGVLQMQVFHVFEDVIVPDFSAPIPGREEKKMAKQIIEMGSGDLDEPNDLVSESRTRLQQMISARLEGKEIPAAPAPAPAPEVDLMDALKQTYDEIQEKKVATKK